MKSFTKKSLALLAVIMMIFSVSFNTIAYAAGETKDQLKTLIDTAVASDYASYIKTEADAVDVALKAANNLYDDIMAEKEVEQTAIDKAYSDLNAALSALSTKDLGKVAKATVEKAEYKGAAFDAAAIKAFVKVTLADKTELTEGTDYTVAIADASADAENAGTVSIAINGTGSYGGKIVTDFTIEPKDISGATVTVAGQSYDGTAKTPEVTVKDAATTLKLGTDYTVSYSDNVNAGNATVVVTGMKNYKNTVTATFAIGGTDLSTAKIGTGNDKAYGVEFDRDDKTYEYTGKEVKPAIKVVKYKADETGNAVLKENNKPVVEKVLVENTDYTVDYNNNVEIGTDTATVTVTGKGGYSNTLSETFSIKTSASKFEVTGKIEDQEYTGNYITPGGLTVKVGNTELKNGTDYNLVYSDNKNVGTATVKVVGTGKYTGEVTYTTFKITPVKLAGNYFISTPLTAVGYDGKDLELTDLTGLVVSKIKKDEKGNPVLNGEKYTPVPGADLTLNTDYKFEFVGAHKDAGKVKVNVVAEGNYTGTIETEVEVQALAITSTDSAKYVKFLTIEDKTSTTVPDVEYTGSPVKVRVVLVDTTGSEDEVVEELKEGTDYVAVYRNNVEVGTNTAAVKIVGIGNYASERTEANFSIVAKALANAKGELAEGVTVDVDLTDKVYTGKEIKPEVKAVKYGNVTLVEDTDYTVKYLYNIAVGKATIEITGKGNYDNTKTAKLNFNIKEDIAAKGSVTISNMLYVYTGAEIKPVATIKYNGVTLTEGTDYELTYANNVNVGTASVVANGKGEYTGSIATPFVITAKSITDNAKDYTITVSGDANKPTVEVKDLTRNVVLGSADYTVEFSVVNGKSVATIKGIGNYNGTVAKEYEVSGGVVSKDLKDLDVVIDTADKVYKGKAIKAKVVVKENGKTLRYGKDYVTTYANNNKVGTATATVTGQGEYTGVVSKTFKIVEKLDINKVNISVVAEKAYTGKAIKSKVVVKNGAATLQYNRDYVVSYTNNTNPGVATVTIEGRGDYAGTKATRTFKILVAQPTSVKDDGAKVTWAAAAGKVDGYEVSVLENGKVVKTVKTSGTSATVKGGDSVRVRAYERVGFKTYYSRPVTVTAK